MALYQDLSERMVREWIALMDEPTLVYLFNKMMVQSRVIKKNGRSVKIIRSGDVIRMLQHEMGVISSALTRSEYISHEPSDIVMRAILGVLDDKHLEQEPKTPVDFPGFEHFLLNDIALSQLFATNSHGIRHKYGCDKPTEDQKRRPIQHCHLSDAEQVANIEEEISRALGGQGDLLAELDDLRRYVAGHCHHLLAVLDLLLEDKSVADIMVHLGRSQSSVYSDIKRLKQIIYDEQQAEAPCY